MITLATFGPYFGLPDASPFVTKAEVLLKMAGVPYQLRPTDIRKAPKGKLPFIEDDGAVVADSTFIRLHLERKYGIDFDRGLTPAQRGTAWAVEKMLEEQFYWIVVQQRWLDDANFRKGPELLFANVPGVIRPLITRMVRRNIRNILRGHGIGRHTTSEVDALGAHCVDAVAGVLGDQLYLTGNQICGADATVYAFLLGAMCPHFDMPICRHVQRHPTLLAYCERMTERFYPERAAQTSAGRSFSNTSATNVTAAVAAR